jgi:hypothetical protein
MKSEKSMENKARFKKIIGAAALTLGMLAASQSQAINYRSLMAPEGAMPFNQQRSPQIQRANLLFVLSARSGLIQHRKNGYFLALNSVDPRILWFMDRPARHAGFTYTNAFLRSWPELFATSAPNASITDTNMLSNNFQEAPMAVTLSNPRVINGVLVFRITALQGSAIQTGSLQFPSLFIDNSGHINAAVGVTASATGAGIIGAGVALRRLKNANPRGAGKISGKAEQGSAEEAGDASDAGAAAENIYDDPYEGAAADAGAGAAAENIYDDPYEGAAADASGDSTYASLDRMPPSENTYATLDKGAPEAGESSEYSALEHGNTYDTVDGDAAKGSEALGDTEYEEVASKIPAKVVGSEPEYAEIGGEPEYAEIGDKASSYELADGDEESPYEDADNLYDKASPGGSGVGEDIIDYRTRAGADLKALNNDASGDAAKTGDVESTAGEDLDKVSSGLDANANDLNTATSTAEQAEGATTGVDTLTGLEGSASGETVGSEAGELIEDSLDLD